jgi:hydroxyacylglutathione hydrolase
MAGWFGASAVQAWAASGRALGTVDTADVEAVVRALETGNAEVVDVRGAAEWEAGHLPGVRNIPLPLLADRLAEIPRDRPIVLHCQGGSRSAIAAGVLRAHGFDAVSNFQAGFPAWARANRPVERGESAGVH